MSKEILLEVKGLCDRIPPYGSFFAVKLPKEIADFITLDHVQDVHILKNTWEGRPIKLKTYFTVRNLLMITYEEISRLQSLLDLSLDNTIRLRYSETPNN